MGADIKKENECFQKDYDKLYAKGTWSKDDLEAMKNYKKLIYYNLAIDGMENGQGFPGSEYTDYQPDMRMMNNGGYGRQNSNNRGGSGMGYGAYPMNGMNNMNMPWESGNRFYDNMGGSGRRYYDDEKKNAIHKLHHMMDNTDDPERKNALRLAINELESR